jgi:hypothetical protein
MPVSFAWVTCLCISMCKHALVWYRYWLSLRTRPSSAVSYDSTIPTSWSNAVYDSEPDVILYPLLLLAQTACAARQSRSMASMFLYPSLATLLSLSLSLSLSLFMLSLSTLLSISLCSLSMLPLSPTLSFSLSLSLARSLLRYIHTFNSPFNTLLINRLHEGESLYDTTRGIDITVCKACVLHDTKGGVDGKGRAE